MSVVKTMVLIVAFTVLGTVVSHSATAQSDKKEIKPIKEGEAAVDFELQSIGKKIKLSDNFGENGKPVVVVFSRANW